MENQFYHIMLPPLNVTIFLLHVRSLCNGCYANEGHVNIVAPNFFENVILQKNSFLNYDSLITQSIPMV